MKKLVSAFYRLASPILGAIMPTKWKEMNELRYWRIKQSEEGTLNNDHYEYFYTGFFGVDKSVYDNAVLMDIGCGPRGSLEWANNAARTIGLDPLANDYLKLGADKHKMKYIASGSENIPLEDGECDYIFSFNSFDHVEDIEKSVHEIKRCLKTGGSLMMIVEVNHDPTACEPHKLSTQGIINVFAPELEHSTPRAFKPVVNGVYESILKDDMFSDAFQTLDEAYLAIEFKKRSN
jgi:ubiquinone/menaquinone biosynthesis C-methylase UbiE